MARPQKNRYGASGFTAKESALIDAYMTNGFRKVDAMRKAGYAEATCVKHTHEPFDRPRVKAEVDRRMAALAEKIELKSEMVVRGLMRMATASEQLAKFKKVDGNGNLYWDFTGATEEELGLVQELGGEIVHKGKGKNPVLKFKIGTGDAKGAWDSLARIAGMFNDKLEVSGEMALVEKLQAGRNRVKAK